MVGDVLRGFQRALVLQIEVIPLKVEICTLRTNTPNAFNSLWRYPKRPHLSFCISCNLLITVARVSVSVRNITNGGVTPDRLRVRTRGSRLAVDRSEQGKGLGKALLRDALARIAQAADVVGVRPVLVHAIDDAARRFHLHHSFQPSPVDPMQLMMLMKDPGPLNIATLFPPSGNPR